MKGELCVIAILMGMVACQREQPKPNPDTGISAAPLTSTYSDDFDALRVLFPKGEWESYRTPELAAADDDPNYLWMVRNDFGECYLECFGFGSTEAAAISSAEERSRLFLERYHKYDQTGEVRR